MRKDQAQNLSRFSRCDLYLRLAKRQTIDRLLEYDHHVQLVESTISHDLPANTAYYGSCSLIYKGSISRMHVTGLRIQSALRKYFVSFQLFDITSSAIYFMFWEKESKGRSLPALVEHGRIIGVSYDLYPPDEISLIEYLAKR